MASVAYMDLFIGLLATFTLCTALPVLIHHGGGWHVVREALPASHFQLFGDLTPLKCLELFLPTCLLLLGNQSMYQKFFSARSQKDASRAVVGWIVGTVILETVIVALAITGSALFPTGEVHDRPREILAYIGLHGFEPAPAITVVMDPNGTVQSFTHIANTAVSTQSLFLFQLLGALLMGAIFAKIISTANNWLFSPATNLVNDIFVRYIKPQASNKQILIVSRLMVVLLGLWSLFQSLGTESVLKKALYAYTIYGAALTPVILAAFFWRRATAAAAVASIAIGTVVTVSWDTAFVHAYLPAVLAERDAIFPALVASLLCLVIVSLITPPPSAKQLQPFVEAESTV
jgi:SSS family solute:Na+ symporter/sodium/proline symporter